MNAKDIFSPYAKIALAAKLELKILEKKLRNSKDSYQKRILKRQHADIKSLINRSLRLTGDFVPVHISRNAKKYCDNKNLGDIFKIRWNDQAKFEKQLNREKCCLKHEHKTSVGDLVESII